MFFKDDWPDRGWKTEFGGYHEAADDQIRQPLWVQFPILYGRWISPGGIKNLTPYNICRVFMELQLGQGTRVRTALIGSSMPSTILLSSGANNFHLLNSILPYKSFEGPPLWRSSWLAMRCWPTHREISQQNRWIDNMDQNNLCNDKEKHTALS